MAQNTLFPQGMFPQAQFNPITGAKQAPNFGTGASFSPWAFASGLVNPQPFGGPMDPNTAAKAEIAALRPALNKDLLQAAHTGGSGGFKFDDSSSPAAEIYGQLGQEANEAANAIQAKYGLEAWKIEQENKKDDENKAWSLLSSMMSGGGGGGGGMTGGGGGGGGSAGGGGGAAGSSIDMQIAELEAEMAGLLPPSSNSTANASDFYLDYLLQKDAEQKAKQNAARGNGPFIPMRGFIPGNQPDRAQYPEGPDGDAKYQRDLQSYNTRLQTYQWEQQERARKQALHDAAREGKLPAGWEKELDDRAYLEWKKRKENAQRVQDTASQQYKAQLAAYQKRLEALRRIQSQERQRSAGQYSGSFKDPYQERMWSYIERLLRGE